MPYCPPPFIQDIGHGVQLCTQDQIASKTFGGFMDRSGAFHFGYFYRNGSNIRVAFWKNDQRWNRTIPARQSVLVFPDQTTQLGFKGAFTTENFNFQWFNTNHQQVLQHELIAYNNMQPSMPDFTKQMAGLPIWSKHNWQITDNWQIQCIIDPNNNLQQKIQVLQKSEKRKKAGDTPGNNPMAWPVARASAQPLLSGGHGQLFGPC